MKKAGGRTKIKIKKQKKATKKHNGRNGEAGGDGEEHEPGGRVLLLPSAISSERVR